MIDSQTRIALEDLARAATNADVLALIDILLEADFRAMQVRMSSSMKTLARRETIFSGALPTNQRRLRSAMDSGQRRRVHDILERAQ